MRCKDCDISPGSQAKPAKWGERFGRDAGELELVLKASYGQFRSGSLHAGSAEKSDSDFVLPRQKINQGGQARKKIPHGG